MKKIPSFEIDHTKLLPGIYVSRKDCIGQEIVTTFDIRVCRPNVEQVMRTDEIHTIEHIAATYLRNNSIWRDKIIYFGPMGCRTGFYLIVCGDYTSLDVKQLVYDCFTFIKEFDGPIPGADAISCGNYTDMNLQLAKERANSYINIIKNATEKHFIYTNSDVEVSE